MCWQKQAAGGLGKRGSHARTYYCYDAQYKLKEVGDVPCRDEQFAARARFPNLSAIKQQASEPGASQQRVVCKLSLQRTSDIIALVMRI